MTNKNKKRNKNRNKKNIDRTYITKVEADYLNGRISVNNYEKYFKLY